jgi:serine protease Do
VSVNKLMARWGSLWSLSCLVIAASCVSRVENLLHAGPVEVPAAVREAEQRRIEVMRSVAPSVVAIFASGGNGGGSGVLINSDGLTVTNFHVVDGLGGFMKCGLNDGKIYDAVLIGIDPTGDVALIQLLGRNDFPYAKIGDSDDVRLGDETFAMGNPFLLATDFQPTVTYGIVSGVHRYQYPAGTFLEYTDCIQVDASINPGNSGGPLFNIRGELIGINGRISIQQRGRVNVGAGYAISINQVMYFLDHLKSGRIVDHATLGATVAAHPDGSVVVDQILETSEAYRRGLRQHDEILSFAGRPIRSVNQFKNILGIYPKGWIVPMTCRRDGQRFDIEVRLAGLHRRAELFGSEEEDEPRPGPDRSPLPDLHPPKEKKQEIPEEYAGMYIERKEFANYYFNLQHQKRVLQGLKEWGPYASQLRAWSLTGTLNGSSPVEIRMLPTAIAGKFGPQFAVQELNQDFADLPPDSGGLLAALEQLKHFLTDPDDYFTEFYYLGSEPFRGTGEKVDVLISTKSQVTCRWYFLREDGRFVGFDTSLSDDVDPCEIRFGALRSLGEVQFPQSLTIRYSDQPFGELVVTGLQFFAPPDAGTKQP